MPEARRPAVEWIQLRPGTLVTDRLLVDFGAIALTRRRFGVAFKGEGDVGSGTTFFGLLENASGSARWDGLDITRDDVATTRGRFDICAGAAESFYTVTVRDERHSFREVPSEPALTRSRFASELRRYLRFVLTDGDLAVRNAQTIEGNLIPLLAAAVSGDGEPVEPSRPRSRRIKAVRECQAYIQDRMAETVTLRQLSAVSGLRPRSLINAFEAVTGTSPMAYLRAQRLGHVRRALERANRARTRVIDVAANWGFWHMGHFASAYRVMFGETPSQTLSKR